MDPTCDVLIAGGGPVGALLALALEESPLAILQVDSAEQGTERPIALAHGSRLLLERCGVFASIPNTLISTIHVSQRAAFGRALIRAEDYGLPALGYVAAYSAIRAAIAGKVKTAPLAGRIAAWSKTHDGMAVTVRLPDGGEQSINTRLLVLADGSDITAISDKAEIDAARVRSLRVHDYAQSAVVTQVRAARPHRNTAYERFTPDGPLALLPNRDGHALVWCTKAEEARDLCQMDSENFLARLGTAFGTRLGKFIACGERQSFPLALRYIKSSAEPGVIAIGNAAQTLHPVAGQGMNLGLRDAWELAASIQHPHGAIDQPEFSSRYLRRRSTDRRAEIGLTDLLVRTFSNHSVLLGAARGAALLAIDTLPQARRILAGAMMYGVRSGR